MSRPQKGVRRAILAAILACFPLAFSAVPAQASPVHSVLGCGDYDWQVTGSGLSQGAGATWDDSCGNTMQVRALCWFPPSGVTQYAYSGEVSRNGVLNWAGCGFGWSVLLGQIQAPDCDCGTWHTFWTGGREAMRL